MGRILLVDDEPSMRRILATTSVWTTIRLGKQVGVEEAQRLLAANDFDVIITDQKMPDGDGLTVLTAAHEIDPTIPVILLTAVASIELAVESMRHGAFDFLAKPFQPEVVRATVSRACERTRLLRENILLKDAVVRLEGASEIYGDSPAIRDVRDRIARVAPTHATVLITGETGTGKELVARAIHRNSPRASKPFVAVTARHSPKLCSKVNSSATKKERLRAPTASARDCLKPLTRARCFSTKREKCRWPRKPSCCASSPMANCCGLVPPVRAELTSGSWSPLTAISNNGSRKDSSGRISSIAGSRSNPPSALARTPRDIRGLSDIFCQQIATELKMPRRRLPEALEKLQQYYFPGTYAS